MKPIIVQELKSPGCQICAKFEDFWKNKIAGQFPNAELKTIDVTTPEGQELTQKFMIFASPGLIINEELFSTGGFDEEKFIDKVKTLGE